MRLPAKRSRPKGSKAASTASPSYSESLATDPLPRIVVGSEWRRPPAQLDEAIALAGQTNQNFVTLPLFHPRYRRPLDRTQHNTLQGTLTRSEFLLDHDDWVAHVIGQFSSWIHLDSSHPVIRAKSEAAFREEYAYACHLGLQSVIFSSHPLANALDCQAFRLIAQLLSRSSSSSSSPQIWVQISLNSNHLAQDWQGWNRLRQATDHDVKLGVVLELLPGHSPTDFSSHPMIQLWAAEPVKAVIVPTTLFVRGEEGLKMSRSLRHLLYWLAVQRHAHIILRGDPVYDDRVLSYVNYLERLPRLVKLNRSKEEKLRDQFNRNYADNLLSPLDPLCVNLDSVTYRMMEADPVKYQSYSDALYQAMKDRMASRMLTSAGNGQQGQQAMRVLVVGPGRGPLIAATLQRFQQLQDETTTVKKQRKQWWQLQLVAVEKNANAVITLRNRFANEINEGLVTIVHADMRHLAVRCSQDSKLAELFQDKMDVIVSELLGSFGDNEASPECLNSIQYLLDEEGGVMIPQSYTSYLAPIASSKLWMHARLSSLDRLFVVQMESFAPLAEPQETFHFDHPVASSPSRASINSSLTQYKELRFSIDQAAGIVHGFAGYFTCRLYGDITLSTLPVDHSRGMFSWFPAFLPITSPLTVCKGQEVVAQVWRCSEEHNKMWYEWSASLANPAVVSEGSTVVLHQLAIQNVDGKAYSVSL
eukprot:gene3535-3872_t